MSERRVFNPRLIGGIAAAGIAAFAAFVLLIAFGGSLASGNDGRAHPLSNSAIGFSGLVRLVSDRNETALVRRRDELYSEDLLVVPLEERTDARQLATLRGIRRDLPTLFILPKWHVTPDPDRRSWVRYVGAGAEVEYLGAGFRLRLARGASRERADGHGPLAGVAPPVPAHAQSASGKDLRPLLTTGDGRILVGQFGSAPHYVVADPDLLNNHGIADRERAWAAVRMLEELNGAEGESINFDLTLSGFGAGEGRNLLRLMLEPPFLAMTLALVVAAFLAGFHGLSRFGPQRREERAIAFGKAALVENSAGLVRQARRETRLGAGYADLIRQEAARITAAPRGLSGKALDEYLDRFSGAQAPRFSELAARLDLARDRDGLVSAARALASWKEELIR